MYYKWSSQCLGSVSLESNDVMIPYYDVELWRWRFHQGDHLISQIFNSRDKYKFKQFSPQWCRSNVFSFLHLWISVFKAEPFTCRQKFRARHSRWMQLLKIYVNESNELIWYHLYRLLLSIVKIVVPISYITKQVRKAFHLEKSSICESSMKLIPYKFTILKFGVCDLILEMFITS